MRNFLSLLLLVSVCSCKSAPPILNNASWLVGSWQIEGTDKMEIWNAINKYSYSGMVIKNNEEQAVLEYLRFYKLDDLWHYSATVPDQNRGREIIFDESNSSFKSFKVENLLHDFPKSIEYNLINISEIEVILNKDLDGEFKLQMTKIESED